MASYLTVAHRSVFEMDPVKGSRFVADVAPVGTVEEAMAFVEEIRTERAGASHHCWAWLLRDEQSRSSDDGEPGGSAGRPILAMIQGHELADVAVVVTRWFGGTKLGVGGLIRAYGGCAGKALDRSELREVVDTRDVTCVHAFSDSAAVQGGLARFGLEPIAAEYTHEVTLTLRVPTDQAPELLQALTDATRGRARLES